MTTLKDNPYSLNIQEVIEKNKFHFFSKNHLTYRQTALIVYNS